MRNLITITILIFLLSEVQSFISTSYQGWRNCYSSEVTHDKTLEIRFGFPRNENKDCEMRLSIHYVSNYEEDRKQLYNGNFSCFAMKAREPFVFKHNSLIDQELGSYEICVQNTKDYNTHNNTHFELQIAEKYDPVLYGETDSVPLVESTDVIEMQEMIMRIKKTLNWCQIHANEARGSGNHVEKLISDTDALTKRITYLQIIFIIVYGVVWFLAVRSLNERQ